MDSPLDDAGEFCAEGAAGLKRRRLGAQSRRGPTSGLESDLWAQGVLESLKLSGLLKCFGEALPLRMSTDYSGLGSAEEAVRQLIAAWQDEQGGESRHGSSMSWQELPPPVLVERAGDKDETCRSLLLLHEGFAAPRCVFGDIGERCDRRIWEKTAEDLKRLQKSAAARSLVSAPELAVHLRERFAAQALGSVSSYCFRHKQRCPIVAASAEAACPSHACSGAAAVPSKEPTAAQLQLHIAGFSCLDWSQMGSEKGWYGDSTLPFMQWVAERFACEEHIIIAENTLQFDRKTFAKILEPKYSLSCLSVSPAMLGEPVQRQRWYMIALRKGQRRWRRRGLSDADAEQPADSFLQRWFEDMFAKSVQMCPEQKFRAPPSLVQDFVKGLVVASTLPETSRSGQAWSCYQAMSAALRRKVEEHKRWLTQEAGEDELLLPAASMWTTNLAQSATFMPPTSGLVPAMLQKTILWLFGKRRLALPQEHLDCQGWNIFGEGASACPFRQ